MLFCKSINVVSPDFVMNVDHDLLADMAKLTKEYGDNIRYRDLPQDALSKLNDVLYKVRHAVLNANKLHSESLSKAVADIANPGIDQLREQRELKLHGKGFDRARVFFNLDLADSFTFFEGLGDKSRPILDALYKDGFGKLVRNVLEAQDFFQELDARYKNAGIVGWGGDKAEARTYKLPGGELTMTPAQVMSLYLLNKREQARGHIYGNGIRVEQTTAKQDGKTIRRKQADPVIVSEADVGMILASMTDQQRRAADDIAGFLTTTAARWGNEVSMKLYGYNKFTEQFYFPIRSDSNYTVSRDPNKAESINALMNMGMTKNLVQNANNAIMVGDIFSVVQQHITDMANYNAFAVPLSDTMKWLNYKREVRNDKRFVDTCEKKEKTRNC